MKANTVFEAMCRVLGIENEVSKKELKTCLMLYVEAWYMDMEEVPNLIEPLELFEPRSGQEYWFITPSGLKDSTNWSGSTLDYLNLKVGNCFRTIYEAEENKNRIMNEICDTKNNL